MFLPPRILISINSTWISVDTEINKLNGKWNFKIRNLPEIACNLNSALQRIKYQDLNKKYKVFKDKSIG